jgi:hypothetical protein
LSYRYEYVKSIKGAGPRRVVATTDLNETKRRRRGIRGTRALERTRAAP